MLKSEMFWAKSEPFESVELHLIRTGIICKLSLKSTTLKHVFKVLKDNCIYNSEEELLNFVSYLISMHDIGKVSPFFQSKNDEMFNLLKENNLYCSGNGNFRHEKQSEYYMEEIFFEKYNLSEDMIFDICKVIGMHHNKTREGNYCEIISKEKKEKWLDFVFEIEDVVSKYFGIQKNINIQIANKDVFYYYMWGLMIICDWLSSKFFVEDKYNINIENPNEKEIVNLLCKHGFGLRNIKWHEISFDTILGIKNPELREIQNWCVDFFDNQNTFDLMMVEGDTGIGKTSIALYSALKQLKKDEGFYFALPQKNMVNSKYIEIKDILDNFNIKPVLLHSGRELIEDLDESYSYFDEFLEETVDVNSYLTDSRRRGLFNQCIVGTIDQLLQSVLPNRFSVLKLIGLAGKTIILDEIHSYSPYTLSLICTFLKWCKVLQIKVIIMSATLPMKLKKQLISAYKGSDVTLSNNGFPLITILKDNELYEYSDFCSEIEKTVELELNFCLNNLDKQCDNIFDVYNNNDFNIIVYKNTVESAQNLYKLLKKKGVINLILCHSRFKMEDREKIDKNVCGLFGKDIKNRPQKCIVICTQVYEACLDLNFDFCFSDICPIDILIQRLGRLHRFNIDSQKGKKCKCMIFGDSEYNFGNSSFIYPEIFLLNTQKYVEKKDKIITPNDLRESIENVYSCFDFSDESICNLYAEYLTKKGLSESVGYLSAIQPPNDKKFTLSVKKYSVLDEDDIKSVSTREFSDSFSIIPIDNKELECYNRYKLNKSFNIFKLLKRKSLSINSYYISFDNDSNYLPIEKGDGRLKNDFIIVLDDNGEYYFKHKSIKGISYNSEVGLEIIRR